MAVIEMEDGTSALIYHNWLYPENTAKLTVIGSKRLVVYEDKFEKRSITVHEYRVENSPVGKPLADELETTIPSKMLVGREIGGFRDQEPLAGAVKDFLESISEGRLRYRTETLLCKCSLFSKRANDPFAPTAQE